MSKRVTELRSNVAEKDNAVSGTRRPKFWFDSVSFPEQKAKTVNPGICFFFQRNFWKETALQLGNSGLPRINYTIIPSGPGMITDPSGLQARPSDTRD